MNPPTPAPPPWTAAAAGADQAGVRAEVLELLITTLERLRVHLHEHVAAFELNPMQFFALRALTAPTPMGQLAERLHCDRSHVTGVADELERRGAIERRPHEHDRRVKLLVLTSAGERLRAEVERRLLEQLPVVAGLSVADQRQLRDLLARVVAAQLSSDGDPPPPAPGPVA